MSATAARAVVAECRSRPSRAQARPKALRLVAPPPSPKVAETSFQPRRRDWLFLEALQQTIAAGERSTNAAIAARLGVSRESVRKRLARNPLLVTWLNGQLRAARTRAWPLVLARAFALAMQGSVPHMDFLARVHGWYPASAGRQKGGAA